MLGNLGWSSYQSHPVLLAEKKHLHQNLHASAICQEGSGSNMCPEIINCFQVKRDSSHLKLGVGFKGNKKS